MAKQSKQKSEVVKGLVGVLFLALALTGLVCAISDALLGKASHWYDITFGVPVAVASIIYLYKIGFLVPAFIFSFTSHEYEGERGEQEPIG